MSKACAHMRTPGDENTPVCNKDLETIRGKPKSGHAFTWSFDKMNCTACLSRIKRHPQLYNAIMSARQTSIPGAE